MEEKLDTMHTFFQRDKKKFYYSRIFIYALSSPLDKCYRYTIDD